MWVEWTLLLASVVVHEIGHYTAFRVFGHKADIRMKWYGIVVGQNVWLDVKVKHAIVILMAGPIAGMSMIWHLSQEAKLIYLAMSILDLMMMVDLMPKARENKTIRDVHVETLKEMLKVP